MNKRKQDRQLSELKDGLIEERARLAVGITGEIYTQSTRHWANKDGKALCGFKGKTFKEAGLALERMNRCLRCERILRGMIEAEKASQLRHYWEKPEAKGVVSVLPQEGKAGGKKPHPLAHYKQPTLVEEPEEPPIRKGLF